jgi:mono/diheme cytochrome c family protein
MKKSPTSVLLLLSTFLFVCALLYSCSSNLYSAKKNPKLKDQSIYQATGSKQYSGYKRQARRESRKLWHTGKKVFRYDTFGDEAFWSDTLRLHEFIARDKFGGKGPGLTPMQALELGLKVDKKKLTPPVVLATRLGLVPFDSPFITMVLLKVNSVVGVRAHFKSPLSLQLKAVGITCAVCHSTTDNSVGPGIGKRLDGWPNRDLDVGKIAASAPNIEYLADKSGINVAELLKVLHSWGPGKYDAEFNHDGKGFRPDGKTAATLLPAAFGMAGVNLHTYGGWGSVTHWNAYVANTQMYGQGRFYDPRMNDPVKYPLAVKNGTWNIKDSVDLISGKLAALHFYQLSLPAPKAPKRLYNKEAALRGEVLFNGKARCASCHVPPLFTEPGYNMHKPEEIGIDDFQANRSPDGMYRTTPLKGLFTRMKGGFYHDGRFADLMAVVNHYDGFMKLNLSDQEKNDLTEYLKSL